MPLLRFDIFEGRSADQIKALLDATHRAVETAFGVPEHDRYQIVHKRKDKEAFYDLLCKGLKKECGIEPSDVVVSIVTNSDEDWSFGYGRAQFLTGELEATPA